MSDQVNFVDTAGGLPYKLFYYFIEEEQTSLLQYIRIYKIFKLLSEHPCGVEL